jgi:gliding motility-associated-like protein
MRIGTADSGQSTPNPCYNGSWGVTVDMTINVTAPPSCVPPTDLAVALNSSDSATVSWTSGGTETAWEYVLQPQGTGAPTAAGTPTSSNPLTLSGLSSGTAYEIYLRADCGAGDFSPWTGPVNFETGPACGDTIYDSGGASGDYSNSELITTTVFPDNPGDVVTFTFLSFDTESCCDGLTVYNGPDTSSDPVDDEFRGTTIPNPITSTDPSGALTFVFDSDGSITGAGYEILISCGPPPSCLVPTNFTATLDALGTAVTLSWDANNGETQWEYVLQPQGTGVPTAAGTPLAVNPITLYGLDWDTDYEVYLRADCGAGDFSDWTAPAVFSTPVQTNFTIDCDAGEVLDLSYCYTNNDTTAWLFTASTAFPVKIVFNSGNIEANWDDITIYDGTDNTGTVLFNNNDADIHDLTGLEFQSTSTAIYMEVDSDGSVSCDSSTTYSPWDFLVSCATCVTQTVDFSIDGTCNPDYEFYVDANISDMGDATSIDLTDNLGIITQTVTSTGVVSLGPYAANQEIIITAVNSNDASCAVESDLLTFICPPPPNECSIVYAGEDSSFCTDNETETTLTATYHILGQDTTEYEITSVNNCEFPSFVGGTPTSIDADDTWSDAIDIGFDFCFFGGTYDQLLIGSNGVVSFELGNSNTGNGWNYSAGDILPNGSNTALSEANIFGVAHDIDPSVGGEINYMVLGTSPSRQFVVNYTNVPLFSAACNDLTATSQIILYESSNVIDINIIDKPTCPTWNGGLAVVGIQNIDDTIAYTPTGRNMGTWDASNESWRFSPSVGTPNYVFEWYDGSTLVGTEETITVSPETTTTYTAAITYNLCTGGTATVTDEVTVDVAATPFPIAADNEILICADDDAVVLEVSLEGAQPVPNNVVYYWTYDGIDIVDGVSEADGGNTITLGGLTPEFDILEGDYLVTALNTVTGCSADTTISVSYYMNENCVDIPQGISPNGDGMNDCLVLDHLEAQEDIIKAEVYNRYGVKVFELNDYIDQWCGQDASDGSGNSNELLPVGTYFYVIQYASGREPTISWIYLNY